MAPCHGKGKKFERHLKRIEIIGGEIGGRNLMENMLAEGGRNWREETVRKMDGDWH